MDSTRINPYVITSMSRPSYQHIAEIIMPESSREVPKGSYTVRVSSLGRMLPSMNAIQSLFNNKANKP